MEAVYETEDVMMMERMSLAAELLSNADREDRLDEAG